MAEEKRIMIKKKKKKLTPKEIIEKALIGQLPIKYTLHFVLFVFLQTHLCKQSDCIASWTAKESIFMATNVLDLSLTFFRHS